MTLLIVIIAIVVYYKCTGLLGFDIDTMSAGWAAITFVFIPLVGIPLLVVGIVSEISERKKIALMTPDSKQKYLQYRLAETKQKNQEIQYGSINTAIICPHCQTKGKTWTKRIMQKKGVSGGKATAAVLTAGVSLLAVGLSRKEEATQAHCDNCNNTWFF